MSPTEYPQSIYGTEVFEDNAPLAANSAYTAGSQPPSVVGCDVATSDVYFSGTLLSEAFYNTTKLFTNGTGVYCTTAQEDNATLEALLRGAINNLTDFSRIIVMRTASDFDRPYPGESVEDNLFYAPQGGFEPSIANIYLAGIKVVEGILNEWNSVFAKGINATNYIGDIFGSLGGQPDFGPGSVFNNNPVVMKKRSTRLRKIQLASK